MNTHPHSHTQETSMATSAAPAYHIFEPREYQERLAKVRAEMARKGLDLCLVSSPENIFYLTGLDHWGYYVPHMLVVPIEGELIIVTRAMEVVTITNQVHNARFVGHSDSESIAVKVLDCLRALAPRRVGLETWAAGFPFGFGQALQAGLPGVEWLDFNYVIDDLRNVKSPAEQVYLREAARVSNAMMKATLEAIHDGVTENQVAAQCYLAMVEAGGSYPGYGPFIRPESRLGEEHGTWGQGTLRRGDVLFLEFSGCVHRYHAPMGRLVHLGPAPRETHHMAGVCKDAFHAVTEALKPGVPARDVYAAWQGVADRAGLSHYRRHHCGYLVGVGVPPSWQGGNRVVGLRHDSDLVMQPGMSYHVLSWLMGTGQGDYFISNTVLLTESGAEILTQGDLGPIER
ncbi:M24 family metallopeptidase [Castellaniella hirudinis]|uniref:M24 family metallopeptidase n=1 Tax=Castellaniella hirudinis TaxID=1144617 RepID=UPI0039C4858D